MTIINVTLAETINQWREDTNTLATQVGDIANLNTSSDSSVVSAINSIANNLGTLSEQDANNVNITGGSITGITNLAVADGGTGADSAGQARTNLGAQATITGAATTITSSDLTASRAIVSNASGKIAVSSVTSTELGYLSGVTSSVQTQLNAKQDSDATLTALAAYNTNGFLVQTAENTFVGRQIRGTVNQINVLNNDGVDGNVTISASIASLVEAQAGTDTTKLMTPQRVSQAIAALDPKTGMTLLGTLTMSSGASQSLTGLDITGYNALFIELDSVSTDNNFASRLRLDNTSGPSFSETVNSSFPTSGWVWIGTQNGMFISVNANSRSSITGSAPFNGGTADMSGRWGRCAITKSSSTVAICLEDIRTSFNGGTVKVYGVK